ncbi:hypothetical protein AWC38_SpisGene15301 [Stylophora pistillata]|uniref:C2H2-type domain-containing protein n=1 Tax=Stylophora pistillata TaxID=50429 RepID=A0A2B4RVB4_STYPI|nr:hypothetical protein AWC38_SpisGene15301 [Stylophora pistillata]
MKICPNHRTKLGSGWSRGSSTRCRVPEEISGHGQGKGLWPKGVCRTCRQRLKEITDSEMHDPPVFAEMGVDCSITDQMERMTLDNYEVTFNLDNVRPTLQAPQGPMRDAETPTSFYQPSESFTTPSGDNFGTSTSREKLNLFLASRDISPIRHVMVTPWEEAAERTKRFHRRKAKQVVFAALKEIAPNSAEMLLDCLQSSNEDATAVIENLGDYSKGLFWAKSQCEKLKQTKRYLKGDFKARFLIGNSVTVLAIVDDVLKQLKSTMPNVNSVHFRQDNAGCYHSTSTLLEIRQVAKKYDINVRLDFSDPQGGKGSCDRKAAAVKNHMRIYVNSGQDVETLEQMRSAVESSGGMPGVRVMLCNTQNIPKSVPVKWEGVSVIHNIEYGNEGMRVWRSYAVGPARTKLPQTQRGEEQLASGVGEASDEQSEDDIECHCKLFACPEEGCVKSFQRFSSLEHHLDVGRHKYALESLTLLDRAMMSYAPKLKQGVATVDNPVEGSGKAKASDSRSSSSMSWALKSSVTQRIRLTENQKQYLTEVFKREQTGKKADPSNAPESMRKKAVQTDEFEDEEDEYAEELNKIHEKNMQDLSNEVMAEISLQHPIMYDTHNICEIAACSRLAKFSVQMLEDICNFYQLDISAINVKRKKPYIDLLTKLVGSCSCNASL